jgi:hypothetical protein
VSPSFWPVAVSATGRVISTGRPGGAGTAVISRTVIVFAAGSTATTDTATGARRGLAVGFAVDFLWSPDAFASSWRQAAPIKLPVRVRTRARTGFIDVSLGAEVLY